MLFRSIGTLAILGFGLSCPVVFAADTPSEPSASTPPTATSPAPGPTQAPGGAAAKPGAASPSAAAPAPATGGQAASTGKTPTETATDTPKGKLASPYQDFAKVADEGHQKFMSAGCNGCHGGGGGGGMGPPLTNQVWIYGKDDDTLFRLVALGSDGLKKQGYSRKGSENVVGPMPAMGGVVKSDDDLWKIIAWIRSVNPSSASSSSASAGTPPAPAIATVDTGGMTPDTCPMTECIEIVEGDITRLDVDAIVNAANKMLAPGGGVCGAIHRAAGPDLAEACAKLGGCATGEAKITPGFRLPARYVIHTVGPVWGGGESGEDRQLAACYRNSLALAAEQGLASIAFPAISTGIFGFPPGRAATIALRTVREALPDFPAIGRVVFCCFGAESREHHEAASAAAPNQGR